MRVFGVVFLFTLFYSSNLLAQSDVGIEEGSNTNPEATESYNFAGPGIFVSERSGSTVTYAYGVEGMRYMKERIDSILESHSDYENPDMKSLQSASDQISRQLERVGSKKSGQPSLQAEETGTECDIPYDLSAEVDPEHRFWYMLATANAGFDQWHELLGPQLDGTGTLTTYAEVSSQWGTTTDSDQVTYDRQGLDGYVEATPASVEKAVFSADCTNGEAISTLSFSSCPNAFVGVAETASIFCD